MGRHRRNEAVRPAGVAEKALLFGLRWCVCRQCSNTSHKTSSTVLRAPGGGTEKKWHLHRMAAPQALPTAIANYAGIWQQLGRRGGKRNARGLCPLKVGNNSLIPRPGVHQDVF